MIAQNLYDKLEIDFIARRGLSDDWKEMGADKYLSPNFKKRSIGIVYDFSTEIKKVYTAVFPENSVIKKILSKKETDILLFVHHPMIWDITKKPIFTSISEKDLKIMKERRISVYCLHVPLDNFGKYSTSGTLAKEMGIKTERQFAPYFGGLCGVIGTIDVDNVKDIKKRFDKILGHKTKLYNYGTDRLKEHKVAVVGGGGNSLDILKEIPKNCNLLITGITVKNAHSKAAHDYLEEKKINLLGGTHYSTEKFACIAMVEYFKKQGLPSEFIAGIPMLEDI